MSEFSASTIDLLDDPDAVAAYDELPFWMAPFGTLLLENIHLQPGMRAISVGCGTGFPLIELAQRLGPGATVYGIDTWQNAIERAEQKCKAFGLDNIHLIHGDVMAVPVKAAPFDLIAVHLGAGHFDAPEKLFARCGEIADADAQLAIMFNPRGYLWEVYDIFARTLDQMDLAISLAELKRHIRRRPTADSVAEALTLAGFTPARTTVRYHRGRYLDGTAFLRHYAVDYRILSPWRQLVPEKNRQAVFTALEANLNQRAAEAGGQLQLTLPYACVTARR